MQAFTQNFQGFVDGEGRIQMMSYPGGVQHVGWTCAKYEEISKLLSDVMDKAESYKRQLEDAGILRREMTEDERFDSLERQLADLAAKVATLTEVIEK